MKIQEAFDSFDTDHSNAIDLNEALRHWGRGFGKLSAQEFFKTVDLNGDGQIEFKEFEAFWRVVRDSGYSEMEI